MILIVGANGQLGRCLRDQTSGLKNFNFTFLDFQKLDITQREQVEACFKKHHPAYCINAAAYTAVDKAEEEQEKVYAVNEMATVHLARASKNYNTVLIHISTDFVFDGDLPRPLRESDATKPKNIYGASKLAGEKALIEMWEKHLIFRTSWLFSEYGRNFLKTMNQLAQLQKDTKVVHDQIGTPTYAGNLAQAIFLSIEQEYPFGMYHYSNEGVASWYDFAYEVFSFHKVTELLTPIPETQYPTPAQRPSYTVLSKEKIKKQGLKIPHWREGIHACLYKLNSEP